MRKQFLFTVIVILVSLSACKKDKELQTFNSILTENNPWRVTLKEVYGEDGYHNKYYVRGLTEDSLVDYAFHEFSADSSYFEFRSNPDTTIEKKWYSYNYNDEMKLAFIYEARSGTDTIIYTITEFGDDFFVTLYRSGLGNQRVEYFDRYESF